MTFPAYPEYKDSGVEWLGYVPQHWNVGRLGWWFDVDLGKMLDEAKITGRHLAPYLRNVDVQWAGINIHDLPYMDFSESDRQRYRLREGDLLVCEGGEIGRCAVWTGKNFECYYQKALHRVRSRGEGDVDFLRFLLFFLSDSGVLDGSATSSTINHLTREQLRYLKIPFPVRREQKQIGQFLYHAIARIDALIEEQQRLIELLKEKRQAVISHAVTKGLDPDVPMKDSGVEWLGEVPAHWEVQKLAHCLKVGIQNGISPSLSDDDTGVKTFSIGAVRLGVLQLEGNTKVADLSLDEARPYFIDRGDVLIIRGNGNIGLVGTGCVVKQRLPEGYIYPDILFRCRTMEARLFPEYLVSLLSSDRVRPQIECLTRTTNGTHKISGDKLSTLRLPIPTVAEQESILDYIHQRMASIDRLLNDAFLAIKLLRERRSALVSAAVTGKIDVRGWRPPTPDMDSPRRATTELPA